MRKEIVRELVDGVKLIAGSGYEVVEKQIKKNNGVEFQAVIVRGPGDVAAPTIYVESYIEKIERDEMTVMEVAQKIFDTYEESKNLDLISETGEFTKKEYILDHVEYKLVNAEKNAEKLQICPNKKILDLAVIYMVVISGDTEGIASYVVQNGMMRITGITLKELDEAAARNTKKVGFIIKTMQEVMAEMTGMPDETAEAMPEGTQMFVLTNERKINGANILLFKDELAKVADKVNDNLFILPSSIHELLAIPAGQADIDILRQMVREVNDTEVAPDEILSYEVYLYNRDTGEIKIAEKLKEARVED